MNLCIHRGTSEIGGSCVELANRDYRILIDIGMPLVGSDGERFEFSNYRGLDLDGLIEEGVLPNVVDAFWGSSAREESPLKGLLLSHAHMDHYGLVRYVREDIPIYLGEATLRLMELGAVITGKDLTIHNPQHFEHGVPFECGRFTITPFLMDHSAFDAYAFLVESEGKRVLYSGDFRSHGRKPGRLPELFAKVAPGVDALLLEGTLVGGDRGVTLTEDQLEGEAAAIMRRSPKVVCAYFSSQNIDRLVSFYKAALRSDRLFVVDVYLAMLLITLTETKSHPQLPVPGFDNLRVIFPSNICKRLRRHGILDEAITRCRQYKIDYKGISENLSRVVMAVRPGLVDFLGRIPGLDGSTLIYSTWRGYEKDAYCTRLLDFARDKQMPIEYLHTTGHALPETLKEVIARLQPKRLIPIHTLHPELYSALGDNVIRLEPGEWLEL